MYPGYDDADYEETDKVGERRGKEDAGGRWSQQPLLETEPSVVDGRCTLTLDLEALWHRFHSPFRSSLPARYICLLLLVEVQGLWHNPSK